MTCPPGLVGILCNAFVPTVGLMERFNELWALVETRFPFALAAALSVEGALPGAGVLPATVGWLPVYEPLLLQVSEVARGALTVLAFIGLVWFVIDRLTPQATI